MYEELTHQAFGVLGANQNAGTLLAEITGLKAGRYKIWGTVTHTVAGGVRLVVVNHANFVIANASDSATNFATQPFGTIVMDILNPTNILRLELEQPTGAQGTASGNLYAQKIAAR